MAMQNKKETGSLPLQGGSGSSVGSNPTVASKGSETKEKVMEDLTLEATESALEELSLEFPCYLIGTLAPNSPENKIGKRLWEAFHHGKLLATAFTPNELKMKLDHLNKRVK